MMLQAVAHDVKNKLAELAMRLLDTDIEAAALALDAADKLSQALLLDNPDRLTTQIDSASPADLLDELAAVHKQLFPEKIIRIDTTAAPTLWYYDVSLMRLGLSNAVHNALKHCVSAVTLRACEDNRYLIFEVRDDGAGFGAEVLDTNWTDVTATVVQLRHHAGYDTGLGLLLAHKIVCAHTLEKDGVVRIGSLTLSNDGGAVTRLAIP
jgi:signal transduction histidine kinase